jgi:hypothetical protein
MSMTAQITCPSCGSGIEIYTQSSAKVAKCDVCQHEVSLNFTANHDKNVLKECGVCDRKDFYAQKDFNRKIGVSLFVVAAILSIWTYGISFIVLYVADLLLFKKLRNAVVCYKCNTIYRGLDNLADIHPFNHEMHDRIVYSDHDFQGQHLEH